MHKLELTSKADIIHISDGDVNICVQGGDSGIEIWSGNKQGVACAALYADENGELTYQTKKGIKYNLTELLEKLSIL